MTRYAITNLNVHGQRVLTFRNQGRYHYDTMTEAEIALMEYQPLLREKVLGDRADTLEVRPVECYENGDAKGIYFD